MNEIITKSITIVSDKMPPDNAFIEQELKNRSIKAIRWAITDVNKNELTLSVCGCFGA